MVELLVVEVDSVDLIVVDVVDLSVGTSTLTVDGVVANVTGFSLFLWH